MGLKFVCPGELGQWPFRWHVTFSFARENYDSSPAFLPGAAWSGFVSKMMSRSLVRTTQLSARQGQVLSPLHCHVGYEARNYNETVEVPNVSMESIDYLILV